MRPDGRSSMVSTHSRLKAAGTTRRYMNLTFTCFNTQPPEGGWTFKRAGLKFWAVSTHSRLKAAGQEPGKLKDRLDVSTHSRLKAAGAGHLVCHRPRVVSTHSRLKAAGRDRRNTGNRPGVSTHSRLKAAGQDCDLMDEAAWFQHTAA